ncbi:MAG: hypothetical protein A2W36_01455 [Chloroflexi bacterium RBG_16_58_14]|nr:MAG: hypothetical protein A2W36_01455 [Chloroflexi bacterium RBG_16_58_14]
MFHGNKQIIQKYDEEVVNGKNLDRIDEFFSDRCLFHGVPYVGMGVEPDDTSGDKVLVRQLAPGSPAQGKLKPGDQIVSAEDENGHWDTFQQLKTASCGQGKVGTWVKMKVFRDGQDLDFKFERALIQGFDFIYSETKDTFRTYLQKDYPDLKVSIHHLVEDGDLVAVYLTNMGTNADYNRQAVWDEFDIYRLKEGKIVEVWGLEDNFSQVKQLGYLIEPPPA